MSDRLIEAREAAGIESAAEAARRLRVPYGTYSLHENGRRGFGASAARYARFYKVRLEWLLTGEGPMKTGQKPPVQTLFEEIRPDLQPEALRFLEFLKNRS